MVRASTIGIGLLFAILLTSCKKKNANVNEEAKDIVKVDTISHGNEEVTNVYNNQTIDLDKISFGGLGLFTPKDTVIKVFGKPDTIVYPNYDCGGWAAPYYYQLMYTHFDYIGSDKENFFLENVRFNEDSYTAILYNGKVLNGLTTVKDFSEILGVTMRDDEIEILLLSTNNSDNDGARFTFKNGKLALFEYWVSC